MCLFQVTLFLILRLLILCNFGISFTIEELKLLNYEVDISVVPVEKEENSNFNVHITSQAGQEFQCVLPQLNEEDFAEKEVISEKDHDVVTLLRPMKSGPCLTKGKDWWTYEFCFGHYIKQYHVEDGHIIGPVLTLGLYESDFDWNNKTSQEKFKHTKQKYHSQYYANGTKCDVTGTPRNAEVRIYCEEDAGDYIFRVDEPESCSYIITIHTSRLCSHPQLKPLSTKRAHVIVCHPLLNEKQYSLYLQKLKEEKAIAEEERNQWLNNQQERLKVMKNEKVPTEESEKEEMRKPRVSEKFTVRKEIDRTADNLLEDLGKDFSSDTSKENSESFSKVLKAFDALFDEFENKKIESVQAKKQSKEKISLTPDTPDSESKMKKKENEKSETPSNIGKEIKSEKSNQDRSDSVNDNTLQVQIRRLEHRSSDSGGKQREVDFQQRKKLEQVVKEKLEMAGLDTGGRRIEVKIITAGYYDNENGKDFPSLTDEETDQFQNMIVALLTGEQDAIEEIKRHHKLEENYKYTWNEEETDDED